MLRITSSFSLPAVRQIHHLLRLPIWSAGVLLLCLLSRGAGAQELYGTILGTVADASGARVAKAQIIVTNTETGNVHALVSNGSGEYRADALSPGTYSVAIKTPGFESFLDPNVTVAFNSEVRVDAALKPGAETQVITVEADSVSLQTDRADVHTNITSKELIDLPQPTRTYETLVGLTPGVNPPTGGFAGAGGTNNPGRSVVVEANGTSNSGTDVRIDGVSAVNGWVQYYSTAVPSTEAIQAVNVVTGTPDAEQGLASGATINVEIKSGTNKFHGEIYEYHEDNALKAKPYAFTTTQAAARKPKLVDNDFGGTLGGPIKRNKLFFFVSYEGDFTSNQGTAYQTIPTGTSGPGQTPTGERAGDFSHSPAYTPGTNCNDFTQTAKQLQGCVYDPAQTALNPTTGKYTQVAFPNNIIPLNRLNPITQQLVALLPAVNVPTNLATSDSNDYLSTYPNKATLHKLDTKITWDASSKLRVSGRYSQYPYSGIQGSTLGDQLGGANFHTQTGDIFATTVAANYLATQHLLFDGSFGFTRAIQTLVPPRNDQKVGSDVLGIPGTNLGTLPAAGGLPDFNISSFSGYGYSYPYLSYTDPVIQYAANGSWSQGKHNLKFGALVAQQRLNHIENNYTYLGFNGGSTTLYGQSVAADNSYADFVLGAVNNRENSQIVDVVSLHTMQYSAYARDQWQLSHNLTLSLGLSYEYYPVPTRGGARSGIEHYDFTTNTYEICGNAGIPNDCGIHVEKDLLDPRVGVAYRPSNTSVIRAGYGIAREQLNMFRDGLYNYPVRLGYVDSAPNNYLPESYVQQGIPVLQPPAAGVGAIPLSAFPRGLSFQASTDQNFTRGYVESYSTAFQQEMGRGWIFSLGYVGTHTVHQHTRYNTNAGMVLGAGAQGQYFYTLPVPGGGNLGVTASETVVRPAETMKYNSLQSTLDKRFTRGFQMHVAYTWSHWIAICCDTSGDGGPQIYIPQYYKLNYVASPGDIRHNVVMSAIYELPFGRGKSYLTHGILSAVAGGWQANTVIGLHTGFPYNITSSGSANLNAPNNTQTPDVTGPLSYTHAGRSPSHQYLSPSAFQEVPSAITTGVYRFGTLGLETARGPQFANVDLGLFRKFPIHEQMQMQFRGEALNLLNHANFGNPSASFSNSSTATSFGVISSVNSGTHLIAERYFRLGLKLTF